MVWKSLGSLADFAQSAKNLFKFDVVSTIGKNADTVGALAKNADTVGALAKNADTLTALAKNADTLGALAKNADTIGALAKNADTLGALAKNADTLGALAKNADTIGALAKNADTVGALAKNADTVGALAKNADTVGALGKNSDALQSLIKADKSFVTKTLDVIKTGGSSVANFTKAHPKLVLAGLGVSGVGIYAAANGLSFGQATDKLGKMAANEVAEVVKATGSAAAQVITQGVAPAIIEVAGASGNAVGGAAGNLIGSTVDGVLNPVANSLGITKSQLLYIIAGIVIFLILIWLYRMFGSSDSDDDYDIKYFSFGFENVNLHNLESLGSTKY